MHAEDGSSSAVLVIVPCRHAVSSRHAAPAACPETARCSVTCGPIPALPRRPPTRATLPSRGSRAVRCAGGGGRVRWSTARIRMPPQLLLMLHVAPCSDLRGAGSHSSRHTRPADGSLLSRGRRVSWRRCRSRRLHAPTVDACPTVTPWLHSHTPLAALACATWCPASTVCPPPATRCSARPSATAASFKCARTTRAAPAASRRQ